MNVKFLSARLIAGILILALMLSGLPSSFAKTQTARAQATSDPVINEFVANHTGTDTNEYVEVFGDPNTDYSAYTLLQIEGDSTGAGVIDSVWAVGTTDANGIWWTGYMNNAIENGTQTLMLVEGFSGSAGTDLDTDNDGTLDVSPWTRLVDDVAVNDGGSSDRAYSGVALTAYYDGFAYAPGGASRIPNGVDTDAVSDWMRNDFDNTGIPGFTGTPVVGEALNTPGAPNEAYTPPDPVINEFVANHTGTDTNEYVEVFGDPNTDYSAYTLLQIEGDSTGAGVIDSVWAVGTTDANGIWWTGYMNNAIENGTQTLMLVEGFSGSAGTDLDTDNDGTLDVSPWTRLVDDVAVNDGGSSDRAYSGVALTAYYDGFAYAPGGASRIPNGVDTDAVSDWMRNDFDNAGIPGFTGTPVVGEALNTPGAPNEAYTPPPEACGDPYTPIYDVQGSGASSPLDGDEVAVEGVVTGDFQLSSQLKGFYIQDPQGDGDPATSDGVFVYASDSLADVDVGERVRVRGYVDEYNDLTEITSVSLVLHCSTGNSIAPTPVSLPVTDVSDFEKYEGMLVTFPQQLTISEYYNFDRYGEIVLTTDRQFTPTAVYDPGTAEQAQLALDNSLSRITLDDGRSVQNPDPAIHPDGANFDLSNLFRGGDLVQNVTGVMDYSFGLYRIQPTQGADYTSANPRPAQPEDVGGNLKVASFNVLNYFTTLNSRGANTEEEFTRQRTKIIAAISQMNADVVGLIEIENNDEAIQDLVEGLNTAMGAGTYAYVDTGVIGTDEIKVAFIYKPATVSLVGDYAILDSSVDSRFIDTKNRPALAQTFQDNTTGGIFTVVVNHLKSKGSACDDVGDPDTGDGAGNCNLTRKAAAEALVDWLATDPTGSGDSDFLIIGDLNSYDKEDPIDAIKAGPDDIPGSADDYTDLLYQYIGEYAYSYVFDGQLGYLDHALASPDLLSEVTGTTVWHINADEPDLIDYDMTYKQDAQDALYEPNAYRSSDHDPVIIGLNVCDEIAPTLDVSVTPDTLGPVNHKYVTVNAEVTVSDNFDPNPTVELVSVTSNEPDNGLGDGDTPNDIVILDDYTFQLRSERSGLDGDRVYTITYKATDACGNVTLASATVTVPHDLGY